MAARRARATLEDLARIFLWEFNRANVGLAESRADMAAELSDEKRRDEIVRSLGGRSRDTDALLAQLESDLTRAGHLGIAEATVTFWVEPARPGFFERFWRFVWRQPRESFDGLYRLVPSKRSAHAIQCAMKIGAAPQAPLTTAGAVMQAPGVLLPPLLPSADQSGLTSVLTQERPT